MPAATFYLTNAGSSLGLKLLQSPPSVEDSISSQTISTTLNLWYGLFDNFGNPGTAALIPKPQDRGWFSEPTDLNPSGQRFLAGNWTVSIKLAASTGTMTVTPRVRLWRWSPGGRSTGNNINSITLIADATLSSTALTTTPTVISGVVSGLLAPFDGNNSNGLDRLYLTIDVLVTANSASQTITIFRNGGASESCVSPGYEAKPLGSDITLQTSRVQSSATSATSMAGSYGLAVSRGSTLLAVVAIRSTTGISAGQVSDNLNGNWTKIATIAGYPFTPGECTVWQVDNARAGTTTVTLTWSPASSATGISVSMVEVQDKLTGTPVTSTATANDTTPTGSLSIPSQMYVMAYTDSDTNLAPNFSPDTITFLERAWLDAYFHGDVNVASYDAAPSGTVNYSSTSNWNGLGTNPWWLLLLGLTVAPSDAANPPFRRYPLPWELLPK